MRRIILEVSLGISMEISRVRFEKNFEIEPSLKMGVRQWVHFQGVHNILDLLSWDQEELKAIPAQQVYSLDDHG